MGKIHDRIKKQARSTSSPSVANLLDLRDTARQRGDRSEVVDEVKAVSVSSTLQARSRIRSRLPLLDEHEIRNAFRKQKYIIVEHPDLGEVALTFPNFLIHAEMAQQVFYNMPAIAAGFFEIFPNSDVRVYGRSESLNLDSRKDLDPALIERTLGIG